jgi:hypothetical protein
MSGLEYFQLALGISESVLHLSQFLVKGLKDSSRYGSGFEDCRLAISMEAEIFKSLKRILFGPVVDASVSSGIFSNLGLQTQLDIINILRRFKESLEAHYQFVIKVYSDASPSLLDVTDASKPFGSSHTASVFRKLRWGFADKAKFDKVVTELSCWNERLRRVVQVQLIQNEVFHSTSSSSTSANLPSQPPSSSISVAIQQSVLADDMETLGLANDVQLARLSLSYDNETADACSQSLTSTRGQIVDPGLYQRAHPILDSYNRRLVQVGNKTVLLEYKDFNADEHGQPPQSSRERISQLASILQNPKSDRYRTLQCDGYYCHRDRFVLAFTLPSQLAPNYIHLHDRLRQSVPDLEDRFALARQLCALLLQLHTVGWVHKSFRSDNILFFAESTSPGQTSTFKNMYLSGWEYSRPELEFSSRHAEAESMGENVYRHPDQWGLPTVQFNRKHDVYALGVVLLEIGRWKRAMSFHHNKFRGCELGSVVRTCLISAAQDPKLRSSMGSRYQAIVLKCLQGSFSTDAASNSSIEFLENEVCQHHLRQPPSTANEETRFLKSWMKSSATCKSSLSLTFSL